MKIQYAILLFLCFNLSSAFAQNDGHANALPPVDENDSLALVSFYHALDGANWTDNSGWLTGPVSLWFGVTIENDRVTEITLSNNNLTGVLPIDLEQLSQLRILSLFLNNISGELPDIFGNMGLLEELVISKNDMTGIVPSSVAELTSLRQLVLLSNEFIGPLPDLGNLKNLEEMVIGRNDFSGPFPDWIMELSSLTFLSVNVMGLTGEMPPGLFDSLPGLEQLKMSGNQLSGDIALWVKGALALTELGIRDNNFTGRLNDGVVDPEILTWDITGNEIEGIPDFTNASETKTWFFLDENKLGFDQLEKALGVMTFDDASRLVLGPQKALLSMDTLLLEPDSEINIQSGSSSNFDSYQWYKNDVMIPDATDGDFAIKAFTEEDAGTYHCVISHPDFEFDLERNPVVLQAEGTTSTRILRADSFTLYPNPAGETLSIQGEYSGVIMISDMSGRQMLQTEDRHVDISSLAPGQYLVHIATEEGTNSMPFVKIE